jgi:hypothetical protein
MHCRWVPRIDASISIQLRSTVLARRRLEMYQRANANEALPSQGGAINEFPTVAHQLGLTATAAKSRLFRARRQIERDLQSVVQRRAA